MSKLGSLMDVFAETEYEDDGENPDNNMGKCTGYGGTTEQAKSTSWKRSSCTHQHAPLSIYALPKTPQELKEDPRTNLAIVGIPIDMVESLSFMSKQGQPLLHFIAKVEKLNSDGKKWATRFFFVTNHAIYALHTDATVARVLPVEELSSITLCEKCVLFQPRDEFDFVVRCTAEEVEQISKVVTSIYEYKNVTPLLVHVTVSEQELVGQAHLQKPKGWKVNPSIPIHTKADLYRQLQLLNERGTFDLDNLDHDPRTDLKLVSVPLEHGNIFKGTPFDPKIADKPLLHFFSVCNKVNHKLKPDPRLLLVTNSNLYLTYPNGNLQRSVFITLITELVKGDKFVALKVPSEFDVVLQFPENTLEAAALGPKAERFVEVITATWKFRNGKELPVREDPDCMSSMVLQKPNKWQPSFSAVMTITDLANHMRALGISQPQATGYDLL